MMHGPEKSDSAIRAMTPANKVATATAEWAEQRAGTEGNTGQPHTRRTQSRGSVSQGLDRVRNAARQRKKEKFTALLHHVTVDLLRDACVCSANLRMRMSSSMRWRSGVPGRVVVSMVGSSR